MFEIEQTPRFVKELKKLQKSEILRILEKLDFAKENPFLSFERMSGLPFFKLRAGKFRIIARIDFQKKQIACVSIGLRKNIYKKL